MITSVDVSVKELRKYAAEPNKNLVKYLRYKILYQGYH